MKDGGPLPPPPPPSYDPDYIQCPYCQRRFSETAAERHIKFCKEQAARITNKGKFPAEAKAKPPARSQYKAPATKKANSPAVSAVSSASSRLPQRSAYGQAGGPTSGKVPPAGPVRSAALGSPARANSTGMTSPPSGIIMKPRTMASTGLQKNTSSGIGMSKRKVYNADNYNSRSGSVGETEVDPPSGQLTKFCHECGTKYPVDSAKFCCQCGIRRMCV